MIKYICDCCGKEIKKGEIKQIKVHDNYTNRVEKEGIHWCKDCVSNNGKPGFNFPILDTSEIEFEIELDKLKVVNANKSTHTDLLCRNINNEIKFMLYTNKVPGMMSGYNVPKQVFNDYVFKGEIFEDNESMSYILGSFESSLFVKFFIILGLALSFMFLTMTLGFIIVPIVFLWGMNYSKKVMNNRLLHKIMKFEEKINNKY